MIRFYHLVNIKTTTMVKRRTYTPIHTDFTPFVSVALLLIVFFMWVKTAEKPTLLQINVPGGFACYYGEHPDADATLFLLANNRIGFLTYRNSTAKLIETDYSAEGIRKELLSITLNHDYGAIVLITPTKSATFKNLVDVIDELRIVGHLQFKLVSFPLPDEGKILDNYKRYLVTRPVSPKWVHLPPYTRQGQ